MIAWVGVAMMVTAAGFLFQGKDSETNERTRTFKDTYHIASPPIPSDASFAGERVPLNDADVRERLDREFLVNTYWQSNTMLLIKLSKKYFPIIEPILKKNGVPDDFKYLAVAESGLTHAVSPAGASGFWQFLASTGRSYGLEVNSYIDERYHIEKSTEAACRYLLKAREKTGSWTMAAAGYNRGMSGIQRDLNKQNGNGYYDLYLNAETARYVFRIIALKYILSNPRTYGFTLEPKDLYAYPKVMELSVDTTVNDLVLFADRYGVRYKDVKLLNRWIRKDEIPNSSGRHYVVQIPNKSRE